jgi:hypothetical protein
MAEDSDPLGNPPDTGDADAYEIVEMEDGKRELTDAEVEDDKSYSWHSSDEEDDGKSVYQQKSKVPNGLR